MNEQIKQRITQLNNGEVPNGYKKTEIGTFPVGWKTTTLDKLLEFKNGVNADKEKYNSGVKMISVMDILTDSPIYYDKIKGQVDIDKKTLGTYSVTYGDILFQRSSETFEDAGKSNVYLDQDRTATYSGFVIRGKKKADYNPYFLNEALRIGQVRNQIIRNAAGSQHINVGQDSLAKIIVPLASDAEQSKIAEILMKWDEAIQLNEQLVEQLAKRKNAITYNLLTSAFRLPGFSEEWKEREISTYLEVRDTQQVPTEEAPLMAFVAGVGIVDKGERYDRSFLVKDDAKKYKRTEMDDFIYSSNNIDVGSIGLNKYGTAVISVVYEIFKVKSNAVPLVISEIIQLPYNLNKILSFRQGALYGQYKIHAEDFLSVKIKVPSYEEQKKIAKLICMLDEELRAKQEYLEKIKQQRKALQQYLLNGIVRV